MCFFSASHARMYSVHMCGMFQFDLVTWEVFEKSDPGKAILNAFLDVCNWICAWTQKPQILAYFVYGEKSRRLNFTQRIGPGTTFFTSTYFSDGHYVQIRAGRRMHLGAPRHPVLQESKKAMAIGSQG